MVCLIKNKQVGKYTAKNAHGVQNCAISAPKNREWKNEKEIYRVYSGRIAGGDCLYDWICGIPGLMAEWIPGALRRSGELEKGAENMTMTYNNARQMRDDYLRGDRQCIYVTAVKVGENERKIAVPTAILNAERRGEVE